MSTISVSELKKKPASQWLKSAGQGDLVITAKGQPVAVLLRLASSSVESTRARRLEVAAPHGVILSDAACEMTDTKCQ
jgi:antitoxin (DNA-binding transcriptional repressor) of toxin-antitoxin stability system